MEGLKDRNIQRVIQESVPGKQITISHIIASPMPDIYERLGVDEKGAIGILTLTPYETAIIAADIATKIADVEIGFLDRNALQKANAYGLLLLGLIALLPGNFSSISFLKIC